MKTDNLEAIKYFFGGGGGDLALLCFWSNTEENSFQIISSVSCLSDAGSCLICVFYVMLLCACALPRQDLISLRSVFALVIRMNI